MDKNQASLNYIIEMRKLTNNQKKFCKKIISKDIKSILDFCSNYFFIEKLNKPINNKHKDKLNIIIYSEFYESHDLTMDFRFLLKFLKEKNYIHFRNDYNITNFIAYIYYDTDNYLKEHLQVFGEMLDTCDEFRQQKFIIQKPVKLFLLSIFGIIFENKDFKPTIFKKIKIYIEKNYRFYSVILAIIMITLVILFWRYDYTSFINMIKSKF